MRGPPSRRRARCAMMWSSNNRIDPAAQQIVCRGGTSSSYENGNQPKRIARGRAAGSVRDGRAECCDSAPPRRSARLWM